MTNHDKCYVKIQIETETNDRNKKPSLHKIGKFCLRKGHLR